MNEVWRPVVGYTELYEVSNHGSVRNAVTKHLLKPYEDNGYNKVVLSRSAIDKKYVKVSKLVAEAFVPNPLGLSKIRHKDLIRTNDHESNLEWCKTPSYSMHALNKPVVVLNKDKEPIALFRSITHAADEYGYSIQLVSKKCKTGKPTREGLYFTYYGSTVTNG